jgi:putative membrane protein
LAAARDQNLKTATTVGGIAGLALLIALLMGSDGATIAHTLERGGWTLLWLVPFRLAFFLLYAIGWLILLHPYDPHRRASLGYLLWVATVREAIDRLLPVASVGGGVAGVHLLRLRGIRPAAAAATVVAEILLTLIACYLFAALGLWLLVGLGASGNYYRRLLAPLLFSLPVPVLTALVFRYGSVFGRLEGLVRPLLGQTALSEGAAMLDRELRTCLRRAKSLLAAGALQFTALLSASFEVWLALRLFGHPLDARSALILESLTQAVRHLAFVIPAGIGVQEAGYMLFGHILGIGGELALSVSMVKRLREVLCGLPALASWQMFEAWRLRSVINHSAGP